MKANHPIVAVVGAGNVGCALAAHLAMTGVDVRLCNRSTGRLQAIRDAGGITLTGAVEGFGFVSMLTDSVAEAVADVDVVAVTVPSPALPHFAGDLAETTSDDQLILLDPGHSGGALYLAAEMERRGGRRNRRICQLSTASHGSRMTGPASVAVFGLAKVTLASIPIDATEDCYTVIDELLPGQVDTAGSVLELDLANMNAVMHPAQMVGNASWIEATAGDFHVYQEGTGPAVSRVIEAVDAERLAIAAALDVPAISFVEFLQQAGYTTADAAAAGRVHRALQEGDAIRSVKAPPTLDHRYLHEDIGWGLVPWMALAEVAGVPTPTMAALTQLGGAMNNIDYRLSGLTLARMGLAGVAHDQIHAFARKGRAPEPV
jgi:opine dehydrogenase